MGAIAAVLLFAAGCGPNQPPLVPAAPVGPAMCATAESVYFSAVTTGPDDDDSVSYRFDWGSDTSDWSRFLRSGVACSLRYAWQIQGSYTVRAQARDLKEHVTDWSPGFAVSVESVCLRPAGRGSGF